MFANVANRSDASAIAAKGVARTIMRRNERQARMGLVGVNADFELSHAVIWGWGALDIFILF